MKSSFSPLKYVVRGKCTVSRLYQPVDLIPQIDAGAARKVKKIEEISSKSARLLQGLFLYLITVLLHWLFLLGFVATHGIAPLSFFRALLYKFLELWSCDFYLAIFPAILSDFSEMTEVLAVIIFRKNIFFFYQVLPDGGFFRSCCRIHINFYKDPK